MVFKMQKKSRYATEFEIDDDFHSGMLSLFLSLTHKNLFWDHIWRHSQGKSHTPWKYQSQRHIKYKKYIFYVFAQQSYIMDQGPLL